MREVKNILITGGAGFIGSNLVEAFLLDARIGKVRVLDDLSNGYLKNIEPFLGHPDFEFIEGDIQDYQMCLRACEDMDFISHQAALGSVPRSIENPMTSASVNILGTVNIMHAAVRTGIDRIILAFSSSTYGDHPDLPKVESKIGQPLSPYAVTKSSIEQFAQVFGSTYGLSWIGLRYFNVFGPKQNPNNPYAAVIPIFSDAFLSGGRCTINGDGETSRDFTYVDNVVQMNERALFTTNKDALNQVYNTACNDQISLNDLVGHLRQKVGGDVEVSYGPERKGDVRHSFADISKAKRLLGYSPEVMFAEGLEKTLEWYKTEKHLDEEA